MKCRQAERLMIDKLYGAFSGWKRRRLEKHLRSCPDCRALYSELEATRRLMARESLEITPPEHISRRILQEAATSAAQRKPRISRNRSWRPVMGIAAVAAVVIAFVTLFNHRYGSPAEYHHEMMKGAPANPSTEGKPIDKAETLGSRAAAGKRKKRTRAKPIPEPETLFRPKADRPMDITTREELPTDSMECDEVVIPTPAPVKITVDGKPLTVYTGVHLDRQPRPVRRVSAEVPANLNTTKKRSIVQFIIDPEGKVVQAKILAGAGDMMGDLVLKAAKRWKFTPGYRHGKPVYSMMTGIVMLSPPDTAKRTGIPETSKHRGAARPTP